MLAINLVGPLRLSKLIAGPMALRESGVVVHLSSDAAVEAHPRRGADSVAKAGLDHLSRIWSADPGAGFVPRVVDDLPTGMRDPGESHFQLLRAFAGAPVLLAAWRHASAADYLQHEFGDATLLTPALPT